MQSEPKTLSNPFAYFAVPQGATMGFNIEDGFNGQPMYVWWIKGQRGGVHVWARTSKLTGWPTEWIGGVECHWAQCPDDSGWFKPDAPSQDDCWLLSAPCWHDGTSLYFSERIAQRLPHPDQPQPIDPENFPIPLIGNILCEWYEERICEDRRDDR